MSPKKICPVCGKKRMFHEDELKAVRENRAMCTKCGLERTYNEFLAEVMQGKHKELIAELRKRMEEGDL